MNIGACQNGHRFPTHLLLIVSDIYHEHGNGASSSVDVICIEKICTVHVRVVQNYLSLKLIAARVTGDW